MQGIYVAGRRPKSKKEIREAAQRAPSLVTLEATSLHGGEYEGPVDEAPAGRPHYFVGPDPYTSRKFYGTVVNGPRGVTVK